MSANECRHLSRCQLVLATFFLTGCARAPSFRHPGVVLSGVAYMPGAERGAYGGRSMAPVAPTY